jgi:tetratricopeptide (TPR) repeat protein
VGRETDIEVLDGQFRTQRNGRRGAGQRDKTKKNNPKAAVSPVTILIHGLPGVGKSALAAAYAGRIARYYPDGVLHGNLGTAGTARDAGAVLGSFLDKLQCPASSDSTDERVAKYQEITSRRKLLVILDAARDEDQVAALLPGGSECAVIITSRRNVGAAMGLRSHLLEIPGTTDAVEMLYSYAQCEVSTHAESAAGIAELCGRLPIALRSAGELVAYGKYSLDDLAQWLGPERTRLDRLDHSGRLLKERLGAEYERLSAKERQAFRRLALLNSTTFLPWVLAPLLEVDLNEAVSIVKRLSEAQLIQVADRDPTGISRFRLHPLVRSFALSKLDDDAGRETADRALDKAYLTTISEVLVRAEPDLDKVLTRRFSGEYSVHQVPVWFRDIAGSGVGYWIRAEYGNLVRSIEIAFENEEWALCWNIAARLGGCVPRFLESEICLGAFELAVSAATADHNAHGVVSASMSRVELLVALERYPEAFEGLREVEQKTLELSREDGGKARGETFLAARHRKEGEAWLQLGSYRKARAAFERALSAAVRAGDDVEVRFIHVLVAEVETAWELKPREDSELFEAAWGDDERIRYHAQLALSEAARGKQRWKNAEQHLRSAMEPSYGDARRRASIEYRLSRLRLSQWRAETSRATRKKLAAMAVGHAAIALLRFESMHNRTGSARARCLLARALIAEDLLPVAEVQSLQAHREIEALLASGTDDDVMAPLIARSDRAHGELLLRQGRLAEACECLARAKQTFRDLADWWSGAEASLLLGTALGRDSRHIEAAASLYSSLEAFESCGDTVCAAEAIDELACISAAAGKRASAREFRREARDLRRNAAWHSASATEEDLDAQGREARSA